ncbi:MAG: hypothetical protein J3Q66DRAFT_364396 [Benniella sp.]|nr:MAG: hypothetical protein J3Q66DRAFT_364396 [Benniella sp.]
MLKRLVLEVEILDVDNRNAAQGILEKERERSGSTVLPSELKLSYSRGESISKEFWEWLWRRCSQVKTLDVGNAGGVIVQSLSEGMLTQMPSLDKIRLGQDAKDAIDLTDNEIATLLSGCRKGWKVVEAKNTVRFRGAAMEALATHFGTLEELAVYGCSGFKGIHLARVLSFSPRLRSLAAIDDELYLRTTYPHFDADTFIDKNHKTGLLNTWACEISLRVLKVKITGIPRPDVNSDGVNERYPGEGRMIQRQVYDRLARLTNLETLWLGHHPFFMDESIPELDDMICRRLSRLDLAQCARVNKKWNKIATPYLWYDIKWVWRGTKEKFFHRMVLEDYLYERRKQQEQELAENSMKQHTQPIPSNSLPALTKYGRWIRHIPEPMYLLSRFQSQQVLIEHGEEPTAHELLRHLYQRCPAVQVQYLYLTGEDLKSDDLLRTFAEIIVPLAHHLHIGNSYDKNYITDSFRLKYLLSGCSSKLEKLTLDVDIRYTEYQDDRENQESLTEGMSVHMLNLNEAVLGRDAYGGLGLTDSEVAKLLSGSCKGWKVVKFGGDAMQALTKTLPTLKELVVDGCGDFTSNDLAQVLSSSPNLHTLVAIDDGPYIMNAFSHFEAGAFIDRDPSTKSLKRWACEVSLKVLKVKITDIPRPDVDGGINERYPGEGQEIQKRVYDRLARLTSLETLWLGHSPNFTYVWRRFGEQKSQDQCLEMTLESGLHKLSGLMDLRVLNVSGMDTRIGPKEVQWMTKYWPRLKAIRGLDKEGGEKEAVKWLQERHPDIDLEKRQ